jgi:hypothetical protein
MKPADFLDEFMTELNAQLALDNERWGDTWLKRPKRGQADRIFDRIETYYAEEQLARQLIGDAKFIDHLPWLKITGLALIGWIRERYPEHFPEY